jgi:histidinol-phosphatase
MPPAAPLPDLDLERAVDVARQAAEAAGAAALRYWRTDLHIERKPDRSPVTAADRAAEAAALAIVEDAFPAYGILSEESAPRRPDAPARWIVDPLDGTRGFSRGAPFWGPAIALEHAGAIVAGAIALPALGEVYWAGRGLGAYRDGTRLQVSAVDDLAEASLSLGELSCLLAPPHGPAVQDLARTVSSARAHGDLYACTLVLNGHADLWLEAGVKIWDIAPLQILIEEAGGRFTDFAGVPTVASGHAVGSNGRLHAAVLARLQAPS